MTATIRHVRHSSVLGTWERWIRAPDPRLAGHLSGAYEGWAEVGTSFVRRRELPSGVIPLILNLGMPYLMPDPRHPDRAPDRFGSFMAGLHERFVLVQATGSSLGVQVNFTPLGAHAILRRPMADLTDRVVDLGDLLGPAGLRLELRLREARSWSDRFSLIDDFLLDRLAAAPASSPGIAWAWGQLELSGGLIPIGVLARTLECSPRHLIAQFRQRIGLPPKSIARVLRFSRAVALFSRDDGRRWADIALDCGYFDQAHLNREFREFAGSTPGDFIGRLLPDQGGVIGD
ncbi:MAG TPA: helix-turn-helix domain-containing protein [Aliidongia sp.]|uniref:AraC family transcriptional regulator n=1 Tax=Aliidongia sp. TaxID=1914230 RepID=UPI002DDD4625|nr:helix-turn-helix domain-containing protein [Aliidongia sp.]HEV2676057.1 helix-turn-helix domain-containing protein [Aliidongia sp.]